MKKSIKAYAAGILTGILCISGIALAGTTTLYDVMTQGIKIVIDGQRIVPKDASGNVVEPFIYNGTTYLPVRAVASALGKEVYWDGPNYTVYLGKMNGSLEYPTKEFDDEDNIGSGGVEYTNAKDNLGNSYLNAMAQGFWGEDKAYETICNMKYTRFKGTIFVPEGVSSSFSSRLVVETDGKRVYTSPEMTKTSAPVDFDVDITGCYDLKVYFTGRDYELCIGDAGFYQ